MEVLVHGVEMLRAGEPHDAHEAVGLAAHGLLTQPVLSIPALVGHTGSITLSHDGGFAALAGKASSLETTTGYTFDTPMLPRQP